MRIECVACYKEEPASTITFGAYDGETEEHGKVARADPCKHARDAGIIDRCHKPTHEVAIALADGDLRVVNDAVDVFITRCKQRER